MNKTHCLLEILDRIEGRYNDILHLTANENVMSEVGYRYHASSLGSRYNMGPGVNGIFQNGNFSAKGMPEVEGLIEEARAKTCAALGAGWLSLNCLSGTHAMMSALLATTAPGDIVMTVPSRQGGHFCTKGILQMSGRGQVDTVYDYDRLTFDVAKTAEAFHRVKARALYLDTSVYLNPHPIAELREALGTNALIIYDASHTVGLILAGRFQAPLIEGADILCANTHKTLPGPHRGIIAFRDHNVGEKVDKSIKSSLVSTVHTGSQLALAITLLEMDEFGKAYADQVISNANCLGQELARRGYSLRTADKQAWTNNHQVHLFRDEHNVRLVEMFVANNISINTSRALGDSLFVRLGVQEVTRRGMKDAEMSTIADFISAVLAGQEVSYRVREFARSYTKVRYGYSLDR